MDILFNENTWTAVFWTALTFGILVVVLAVYGWPKILQALREREKRIEDAIKTAEEKQAEAAETLAQYRHQLEEARVDARKIIEEGKRDAEALKQKHLHEQQQEAEAMKLRAVREISLARDKALAEIHRETVNLSVEIASRVIEKSLSARDHKELIEKALAEAEAAAGEGG